MNKKNPLSDVNTGCRGGDKGEPGQRWRYVLINWEA